MNELKLKGRIFNKKVAYTKTQKAVTTFGLSVWNGKDAEGKNTYEFVNAKHWGEIVDTEGEVDITGRIAFDTWNDQSGKKQVRMYILVNEIRKSSFEHKSSESNDSQLDDSVPDFDDMTIPF